MNCTLNLSAALLSLVCGASFAGLTGDGFGIKLKASVTPALCTSVAVGDIYSSEAQKFNAQDCGCGMVNHACAAEAPGGQNSTILSENRYANDASRVLVTAPVTVNPVWFGKWQGTEQSSLEIDAKSVVYRHRVCDEGRCRPQQLRCKWLQIGDALRERQAGDCTVGYASTTRSMDEVVRFFEKNIALRKRNAVGVCCIDNATAARHALSALERGNYKVLILNDAGAIQEFISNGNYILKNHGYEYTDGSNFYIELFSRKN